MDSLYPYYLVAFRRDRDAFLRRFPHEVLVKEPIASEHPAPEDEFDSGRVTRNPHEEWDVETVASLAEAPAALGEWSVAPVRKAADFPPFNRVIVGRSRVCDVILPFPTVSKIHADLHLEGGRAVRVSDRRSHNGTFVNGVRLSADQAAPVRIGDTLRFGKIDLKLLDASALYDLLLTL